MALPNPEKPRPKNRERGNKTQSDVDLIIAARDSKLVDLYFSLQSFLDEKPELSGYITVVDTYFLKFQQIEVSPRGAGSPFWLAKSGIFAMRVLPA